MPSWRGNHFEPLNISMPRDPYRGKALQNERDCRGHARLSPLSRVASWLVGYWPHNNQSRCCNRLALVWALTDPDAQPDLCPSSHVVVFCWTLGSLLRRVSFLLQECRHLGLRSGRDAHCGERPLAMSHRNLGGPSRPRKQVRMKIQGSVKICLHSLDMGTFRSLQSDSVLLLALLACLPCAGP